jgi:hypothetical protein
MNSLTLRFRVDQFDRSTFLVTDGFLNTEICICADDSERPQGRKAEIRAKFIADALNSRWKLDQEMFSRTWKSASNFN